MRVHAFTSQKAPCIVCKICKTVLDYGGPQCEGEIFVVCDECEKKVNSSEVVLPPPESLKNN